ncbi:MAG: histidine phosphatase family protein [Betaproteobacteria bacterium]|nr:histidine phosphatase family protein [Betaproteobacteria bacterium]
MTRSITRICLVRHGETAWNAEGRVQGQTDVPLNAVGSAQADAVGAALAGERFSAIYSSDLTRVRQTAEPAARRLGLPIRLDAALRERHYGMFETFTYAEVRVRFPEDYARFRKKELDYDFQGGESLRRFNERSLGCVRALAARHAGEAILVFTHGGVLEMLYRDVQAFGLSAPRDFEIPNGALNWVEIAGGAWSVKTWAERAHLPRALDDLPE